MNKKIMHIIILMIILSACKLFNKSQFVSSQKQKPNVLFIMIDDLRADLSCYGQSQIKSPHIDRLAKNGLLFKRAYCQNPVCGASRASILSGLRPTFTRFWDYKAQVDVDAPGTITLPQVFKENGYTTISNGKIFHKRNDANERSWSKRAWHVEDQSGRKMLDEDSKKFIGGTKNRGPFFEAPDVPDNAYPDGQVLEKSIQDLKTLHKEGKPFFLAVGFIKPHLPFYAPKKYWAMYNKDSIRIAKNRARPINAPKSLVGSKEIRFYHGKNIKYNSDEFHLKAKHGYYACVSYVDAMVGKLLTTLKDLKLDQNTIVVLLGDHGWHLGEHNFWGKHNTLHNALCTPLIINAPGYKKGVTSESLVEFVDIYPTLCELVDLEKPKHLQGNSFVPLLNHPTQKWKDVIFSRYKYGDAVVTKDYIYTKYSGNDLEEEMLYDLKNDPEENKNVVRDKEYQQILEKLEKLVLKYNPAK